MRTSFRPTQTQRPFYTGGSIQLSRLSDRIFAVCDETEVSVTSSLTQLSSKIPNLDGSAITCLALSASEDKLIIFSSSLAMTFVSLPSLEIERSVPKSHTAPVLVAAVHPDPAAHLIASGSADGVVKVWTLKGGYCTHVFPAHGGPVSVAMFWGMRLFTGSTDGTVRMFDLMMPKKKGVVLAGHTSTVRGLAVNADESRLYSAGRDKVVLVWNLTSSKNSKRSKSKKSAQRDEPSSGEADRNIQPELINTIPVFDSIECLGITGSASSEPSSSKRKLSGDEMFYTAGESGDLKLFSMAGNLLQTVSPESGSEQEKSVLHSFYNPESDVITVVHADQSIVSYQVSSSNTLTMTRHLIGFSDEIIDVVFVNPKLLAQATNSVSIKLYADRSMDVSLLNGHEGIVLALAKTHDGLLVSASKDATARVWDTEEKRCVAICKGHLESIGAIAAGSLRKILFTASQDKTVKLFDISRAVAGAVSPAHPKAIFTQKIHDAEIYGLALSPNDKLLASACKDKTAAVFTILPDNSGLKQIGVCKGHRKGVWAVQFSTVEQVLATGSGDKTVKIWSLSDFTCLKTFEGHSNSVLQVQFLSLGTQLASSASDGLVKIWSLKEERCVTTLDGHEDKVWAVAVANDGDIIVSGGADSLMTYWDDTTEQVQREQVEARDELMQREQSFNNYLVTKDYRNAILLALAMKQPGRLFKLFTSVHSSRPVPPANDSEEDTILLGLSDTEKKDFLSITGSASIDDIIKNLSALDLNRLLKFIRDWNTTTRSSAVAQRVLNAIFKLRTASDISAACKYQTPSQFKANDETGDFVPVSLEGDGDPKSLNRKREDVMGYGDLLQALQPYTERHLARAEKTVHESYIVDYFLTEMDGMFGAELLNSS